MYIHTYIYIYVETHDNVCVWIYTCDASVCTYEGHVCTHNAGVRDAHTAYGYAWIHAHVMYAHTLQYAIGVRVSGGGASWLAL